MSMRDWEEIEKRVEELLAKMTLHEKVGQLHQVAPSKAGGFEIPVEEAFKLYQSGEMDEKTYEAIRDHRVLNDHEEEIRRGEIGSFISVMDAKTANRYQRIAVEESRLRIPLIFGLDVIHGFRTMFPIPLAEACSFDDGLFEETARAAAKEAAAAGVNWTYAPMVDVARDARWGRVAEGAGEDTYLAARFARAKVRGFQGEDLAAEDRIAACVKHFAAYGAVEGGCDYDTVDMSLPKFFETYYPPYEAAIKAGCASVMMAFNDLNGVPCTTNAWLIQKLLRQDLDFKGVVISDANAIKECVNHGTAADEDEAVKQAIEAGTEMDLGSDLYTARLERLVLEGLVEERYVDEAARHILRLKFALGLFEQPYADTEREGCFLCPEHRELARKAARESIVLLKNENRLLPLARNVKLAVVGAGAADKKQMLGCWSFTGDHEQVVTLVDALREGGYDYRFGTVCGEQTPLNQEELLETVRDAEVILAVAEHLNSGEAQSLADLSLRGEQLEMLRELKKLGKPIVTVLFNGRPLAIPELCELSDALVEAWHLGTEAGNAVADVLFGAYNPSGRLTVTFPSKTGECPIYYNHPNTGRPAGDYFWTNKYMDAPREPLFPFGYGLSYSEFSYGPLELTRTAEGIRAAVSVTNVGEYPGTEIVQLYVHRRNALRVRPVRELKGYARVFLEPGESKKVSIEVSRQELGYYDAKLQYRTDESDFDVWMAHDSSCGSQGRIRV